MTTGVGVSSTCVVVPDCTSSRLEFLPRIPFFLSANVERQVLQNDTGYNDFSDHQSH